MFKRNRILAVVLAVLACSVGLAGPQEAMEKRLRIVNKPKVISIGLADFDLIRTRFKALKGRFVFSDAKGATIASYEFDYTLPVARSHVLFKKKEGMRYASVNIRLIDGDARVFEKNIPLPPVIRTARFAALKGKAVVLPGTSGEPIEPAMSSLRIPDYAKVTGQPLLTAARTIDAAAIQKQVRCKINFPICASDNLSTFGRQTTHPDDVKRKSLYISLRSLLFDQKTMKFKRRTNYLAEVMMDPEWLLPALQAEGDVEVDVPLTHLRIQASNKRVKSRHLGEEPVTGTRGGLMQMVNSVCQDDDGNIYFGASYLGCIRFNVRTREWEEMPVDFASGAGPRHSRYVDFMTNLLPKMEDLPYPRDKVKARRMDTFPHVFHWKGRIYLSFARDAVFNVPSGPSVFFATVMSIPTKHWDAPEKFQKEIKLLAASWPTAEHPLFDDWVKMGQMDRKLLRMEADGNRLYMLSYHNNHIWALDLDEEGNTSRLIHLTGLDARKMATFNVGSPRILTDRQDKSLGMTIDISLEGEEKPRKVFLPIDGDKFTADIPGNALVRPWRHRYPRKTISGSRQYGERVFRKNRLAGYLGWPRQGIKGGRVTIRYDAIAAMRAEPERCGYILDQIGGASMAPVYQVAAVPDQPDLVIGIAEYGYYQATYDLSTADEGYVTKEYMLFDAGDETRKMSLGAGLGPYSHLWHRDGEKLYLYYIGYHRGISRMLYSIGGKPLKRFKMEPLARRLRLDGDAPGPGLKWFRFLEPGLDGKLFFTGTHSANRGGTAYCGGLLYFDTKTLDARHRLSRMSRAYNTGHIAWRVMLGEAADLAQEIYLGGNYNAEYARKMAAEERPASTQPKMFVYKDSRPTGMHDCYAFTFGGNRAHHAFSPDQIHLLMVIEGGGMHRIASLDPIEGRFADVKAVPGGAIGFIKPSRRLIATPDGRTMFYCFDNEERTSATFTEVRTAPDGKLSFVPHLTLTAKDAAQLRGGVVMTFVEDLVSNDGSYDMVIGSRTGDLRYGTSLRIINDFIAARPEAVGDLGVATVTR